LEGISVEDAVERFKDSGYGDFKKAVADSVEKLLSDIQSKYNEIISSSLIDKILDESNEKVRKIAEAKIKAVYKKIGVGR